MVVIGPSTDSIDSDMDYYRTNDNPQGVPGLVRVKGEERWERWHYITGSWSPWPQAKGDVFYSGDWERCTEADIVEAIGRRPPDHLNDRTPEELAAGP